MLRGLLLSLLIAGSAMAEPMEPPRGSELRRELLDAIRGPAERDLGPPVEFVVTRLLAEGDLAFAQLTAQRPGGTPIDMTKIPLLERFDLTPDALDGPRIEAFLERQGSEWRVVDHVVGATDVWWWGYDCARYAAFQPQNACPQG